MVTSKMDNQCCSNEWDSAVRFCASEADCEKAFKRMQLQAGDVEISRKTLEDPMAVAMKR